MTPRQRVEISLRGGHTDLVPFTMYESKIPQCAAERALRNRGMCIVQRQTNVFTTHTPNVTTRQEVFWQEGRRLTRTIYQTPVGDLTTLHEEAGFTTWWHERMFKSPDDFKAIAFYLRDHQFAPNYAAFTARQEELGEDFILRAGFGLEPLQELISGVSMHMEDFAVQWMENRDEMLKLYELVVANRRKIYPLVAQSPALHANYGGNVVVEMIGPATFEQYYLQHYNEAAEIMHGHGKLIGCHYDDDCRLLAPAIARSELDYVEAFTPAPDTDMTLAEARAAWPGKVLWLNFPSSQHLKPDDRVEQLTFELLEQARCADGLIMGVTEDVPPNRWQQSCAAIMTGLERHARERTEYYRS